MKMLLVMASIGILLWVAYGIRESLAPDPEPEVPEQIAPATTTSNFTQSGLAPNQLVPLVILAQREKVTARVKRVIDGDTVELENGDRVRYLGMDTPETKHPDKPVECYGVEASKWNQFLVEGKDVTLQRGFDNKDRYGRLLRYVWVDVELKDGSKENVFVNGFLVSSGHARVPTYTKNQELYQYFTGQEDKARMALSGLWGECPITVTTVDQQEPF